MYAQFIQAHAQIRIAELLREAENDRLVQLAAGPRRPFRSRIADWLLAAAALVEGCPRRAIVRGQSVNSIRRCGGAAEHYLRRGQVGSHVEAMFAALGRCTPSANGA